MYKIRLRFTKTDFMKFISHLDLLRLMERAIRRAGIKMSFSQGFNPHPKISFATAVPVGLSSEGEYMDVEVEEQMDINGCVDKLNAQLPQGIKILAANYVDLKSPALMAIVDASTYAVKCELEHPMKREDLDKAFENFMIQETIIIHKTTKKGRIENTKEIDIRPQIYRLELIQQEDKDFVLKMTLSTGSRGNLKPEIVIEKIKTDMSLPIILSKTRTHRLELYTIKGEQLLSPLEVNA